MVPADAGPGARTAAAAVDIPTKLRIRPAPTSPAAISLWTLRNGVGASVRVPVNIFVSLVGALLRSGQAFAERHGRRRLHRRLGTQGCVVTTPFAAKGPLTRVSGRCVVGVW